MNASELNDLLVQLNFCYSDYTHANYDTFENSIKAIEQLRKERDEARQVLQTVVEEFISDTPQQTPKHECEFISDPERGVCSACETWSDYVRICHPHEDTEEEETP